MPNPSRAVLTLFLWLCLGSRASAVPIRWSLQTRDPKSGEVRVTQEVVDSSRIGVVAVARQRDVALRNLDRARSVIRDFCIEIGDDFWATIPRAESRRVAMMEKAVDQYRELRADHPHDAVVLRDSAEASRRLANLLRVTGRVEKALPLYDEALADLDHAPDDDATWRDRIETLSDRALALQAARGAAAAAPFVEETHALATRYLERFAGSPFAAVMLARATADLARSRRDGGEAAAAGALFEEAVEAFRRQDAQASDDAVFLKLAATTAIGAAQHWREQGDRAAATRAASDARDWAARLEALDADDPNHRLLAAVAIREQVLSADGADASTLDAALESLEAIAAEHPDAPRLQAVLTEKIGRAHV